MSDQSNQPDTTPGTFAWYEIITRDINASTNFYSKLFGWTVDKMDMPGGESYTMFKQGDRPVAGCSVPPADDKESPQMWLNYINVDDLDASIASAKGLGAKVCKERVDMPMGSFAIITDPNGATFALWQPGEECGS